MTFKTIGERLIVSRDSAGIVKVFDEFGAEVATTDTPNVLIASSSQTIIDSVDFVAISEKGITLILPTAASRPRGRTIFFKDESGLITQAQASRVHIVPAAGDDVEGDASGLDLIDAYSFCELYSSGGTRWHLSRWSS